MQRRGFIKLCALTAAAAHVAQAADARARHYARSRLVDESGTPIRAAEVPVDHNLIFDYPYAATPCFLLNLGKPLVAPAVLHTADKRSYRWTGGVGAGRSIVAYSAICAHKMSYPTRQISFISYRTEKAPGDRFADVIHCCSEHSQYDPAHGGRVLAGPAPQPLATILLEHDPADDALYAVGTLGGEMFDEFFTKFGFRLAMEYGGHEHAAAAATCVVRPIESYCRQQVKC